MTVSHGALLCEIKFDFVKLPEDFRALNKSYELQNQFYSIPLFQSYVDS